MTTRPPCASIDSKSGHGKVTPVPNSVRTVGHAASRYRVVGSAGLDKSPTLSIFIRGKMCWLLRPLTSVASLYS